MDIAIPSGNESDFVRHAARLKIENLHFLYPLTLAEKNKDTYKVCVFSNNPNEIRKAKQKGFIVVSTTNDIGVLESKPHFLIELEKLSYKDGLHVRYAGLNQVLCKMMHRHGIALGLSFSSLLHTKGRERAMLLGRMMQNIRLAHKYGVHIQELSFAKEPWDLRGSDLKSFFSLL